MKIGQVLCAVLVTTATSTASTACTDDLEFVASSADGGATGVAGSSARPSSTAGAGSCVEALVCEDFESDTTEFTSEVQGGTLEVTNDRGQESDRSLRATTMTDGDWGRAVYAFPSVASGALYFRAYFFIPEGTVTGLVNLVTFRNPAVPTDVDVNVLAGGAIDVYFHSEAVRYVSDSADFPTGRWTCLEGKLQLSTTAGGASVWLDGEQVLTTPASHNTAQAPGYSNLSVGIHWTEQGQGPAEVFVDDLAIDTSPIGC